MVRKARETHWQEVPTDLLIYLLRIEFQVFPNMDAIILIPSSNASN